MLLRVLRNRKVVIFMAAVVIVAAVMAFFGRVELVSDLGTGGKVSVRFVAPSPWLSGTKSFIELQSSERNRKHGFSCVTTTFYRNNIPVHKGVTVTLDARPDTETTVGEFLREFELGIDPDDFPVPVLEHGDPNTPIGRNFKESQRYYFSPVGVVSMARNEGMVSQILKVTSLSLTTVSTAQNSRSSNLPRPTDNRHR